MKTTKLKKMLGLLLASLALPPGLPAAESGLALNDVLKAVRERDPALAAARAEARRMQGLARAAAAPEAPSLGLEAMGSGPGFDSLGRPASRRWTLGQELPFPPLLRLRGTAAEAEASAAQAEAEGTCLEELAAARQAYWELAAACRLQKALESVGQATAEMAALSKRRAEFGQLDRMGQFMDSMLAMENARLRSLKPQAAQQRRAAEAALQKLMGGDPMEKLPEPALGPEELLRGEVLASAEALARAEKLSPALKAAQKRQAAARASRLAALGAWLPDLMLQASLDEDAQGQRQAGAMLGLRLPWVWWGKTSGEAAAAQAALEGARAQEAQQRLELRRRLAETLGELRADRESLSLALEATLPAALRGLQQARSGFRSAALGPTEILMAVQDYRMAEEDVAALMARGGRAWAQLSLLTGADLDREAKESEVRP